MKAFPLFLFTTLACHFLSGQIDIEGYVFEAGNRGFIEQASVTLSNEKETEFYGQMTTDATGGYKFRVAGPGNYRLRVDKSPYFDYSELITVVGDKAIVYLKHEIKRSPGYAFEITIAEKDPSPDNPKDALHGALIEVYNNTKTREELIIPSLQRPDFKIDLIKGNHYTILIRKEGFLSKRMEAFVDVEGCILCFEGIGTVTPGVSDNLSQENTIGVLLANVEMDRYFEGKVIGLNDIYYDFGKAEITDKAAAELNKVVEFLRDNPRLKIELGSHTDSRGRSSSNLKLSQRRASTAVDYLVEKKGISSERVAAKGYGEVNLTNKCKDGVDCDEEEHLLNRRTELKILDVEEGAGERALRQMKADELMEEILAGIDATGQVKVAAGSNAQDAFDAADKKSDAITSSRKFGDYNESSNSDVIEKPVVIEVEEVQTPATVVVAEPIAVEEQQQPEKVAKEEIVSQQSIVTEEPKETIVVEEVQEVIAAPTTKVITIIPKAKAPPAAVKLDEVESEDYIAAPTSHRYSKDYTGFKVVVIYSRFELPPEHQIFADYKEVDIYTTADNNKLYMLGAFDNRIQAERAMRNTYKKEYPQSYVIGFERGNRVY